MNYKVTTTPLLLVALFLAIAPTANASTARYVNGVNGSDSNNCLSPTTTCKTIGHAISLSVSGDSIRVAAAIYKENLSIGFNLNILGSNAATTIIDGGGVRGVVEISSASAHVTLSGLTIRNGGWDYGAGIYNDGTLRLVNSTVSGNTVAPPYCPAYVCFALGGGIYNTGTVTISNSTLSGNTAHVQCSHDCVAEGGGIFNAQGTLTINNSTLSGNSAIAVRSAIPSGGYGGGISNNGTLTINNSTLSGNASPSGGSGGGIANGGTATLQNSIVANSPSGGNCFGTMTSKGYNLSSDGSCDFDGPGDRNNTNPMLAPLQNNGGSTKTMALLPGSPAIDAGNPTGCTDGLGHLLKTDQRGDPRPNTEDTGGCDMGAYERQSD
jgi:hypothetical protein